MKTVFHKPINWQSFQVTSDRLAPKSPFFLVFLALCLVVSGCDEEKGIEEKGYALFCWPSKTACQNREYGIEFSYQMYRIEMVNGVVESRKVRMATLICCSKIMALMDTLAAYNDTLTKHQQQPLGNLNLGRELGDGLRVFASYSSDWQTGKSISFFGFTDIEHPYGFTMYPPQGEYFKEFYDDVIEKYRTCCLREEPR